MRIKTANAAIKDYLSQNPDSKSIKLSKALKNNIVDEFDFHNDEIDDDEEFNKVIFEVVKNAYETQSYAEKQRKVNFSPSYDLVITMDNVFLDVNTALETDLRSRKFDFRLSNVRTYDFNKHAPSDYDEFFIDASPFTIHQTLCNADLLKKAEVDMSVVTLLKNMAENNIKILVLETYRSESVKTFKTQLFEELFDGVKNIDFEIQDFETSPKRMKRTTRSIVTDNHTLMMAYPDDTVKCLIDKPYNQEEYNNKYNTLFRQPTFKRYQITSAAVKHAVKSSR